MKKNKENKWTMSFHLLFEYIKNERGKKKRKEIIIIWLDKRSEKKKYNYYQMTILPSYKYVYITNLTDIFKHTVYIIKKIILVLKENI